VHGDCAVHNESRRGHARSAYASGYATRVWNKLLIFSSTVAVLSAGVALADDSTAALERQIEQLTARVAELEAENSALRAEKGPDKAETGPDRAQGEGRDEERADAHSENQELRAALAQSRQAAEDLSAERDKLQRLAGLPPMEVSHARIVSEYVPERNVTRVLARPMLIPASAAGLATPHSLGVEFNFEGESAAVPVREGWLVITTASNPSNRYKKLKQVVLAADDLEFELAVSSYEITHVRRVGSPRSVAKRYNERITVDVDYATLRQLARASQLTMDLGRNAFPLTPNHTALLGAIVERMRETGAQ
jgi:hypothetical protein